MIRVSPYTPIFFNPTTDTTGVDSRYIQTYATSDQILLEVVADLGDAAPSVQLHNLITETRSDVVMESWQMNANTTIYYRVFQNMAKGYYKLSVEGLESEIFCITDDVELLKDSILLQYSMKDNKRTQDAVFFIDKTQYFFDFRVPGGFKDSGWGFQVDSDQFVTQHSDIISVYAQSSTQKALTVGTQMGCPIWFGEMLNRLLCCDYVYVDGVRYTRKESSVPEATEVLEGSRSFVFRQLLQKVNQLDAEIEDNNRMIYRRTVDDMRRADIDEELRLRTI